MTSRQLQQVLICFADPSESQFLRKLRTDLRYLHTGMGFENASRALKAYLRTTRPSLIVSAGFAGGLNPELGTGSLIWQPGPIPMDDAIDVPSPSRKGTFLSSSRIITTSDEKGDLWQREKKDAVEMESEAIHKIAAAENIPSLTLRVISDSSEENLPLDFNEFMTTEMKLSYLRLFLTLARRPSTIPSLIRFSKKVRNASRILGESISALLPIDERHA